MTIIITANNNENANFIINMFEKSFHFFFNGFGGKRINSWKEQNLIKVKMTYDIDNSHRKQVFMNRVNESLCRNHAWNAEIDEMWYEVV